MQQTPQSEAKTLANINFNEEQFNQIVEAISSKVLDKIKNQLNRVENRLEDMDYSIQKQIQQIKLEVEDSSFSSFSTSHFQRHQFPVMTGSRHTAQNFGGGEGSNYPEHREAISWLEQE